MMHSWSLSSIPANEVEQVLDLLEKFLRQRDCLSVGRQITAVVGAQVRKRAINIVIARDALIEPTSKSTLRNLVPRRVENVYKLKLEVTQNTSQPADKLWAL
jgi:hypothetical protein